MNSYMRRDPVISGIVTKDLFKIFVQICNCSPLQSIPLVTGYSDPSAAGNIV
jgi:hypothetical protein